MSARPSSLYVAGTTRLTIGLDVRDTSGFSWSSDGTKIAFADSPSAEVSKTKIFTMNADGTNITNISAVVPGDGLDLYPSWSPDGSKIIFYRVDASGQSLYVMDFDGNNPTLLVGPAAFGIFLRFPQYSPDGSSILYTLSDFFAGTTKYITVDSNGSTNEIIINTVDSLSIFIEPSWSPDGNSIAYTDLINSIHIIHVMDSDGTNKRRIQHNGPVTDESHPSWSPDGSKITFQKNDSVGPVGIHIMNSDGTDLNNFGDEYSYPNTSPDGTKILCWARGEVSSIRGDLYILSLKEKLQGRRPVKVIQYFPPPPPEDVTIYIQADTGMYGGRENSDGRYYTITFPDDYIGTIGTATDPFKDVRTTPTGPIGLPDGTSQLNVVLNIPEGMQIGANVSNVLIPTVDRLDYNPIRWPTVSESLYVTDPSLHIKLNTDQWSETVLTALNIKVNNYGTVIGGGGSGGYGGGQNLGTKTTQIKPSGGGGSGQGLHPAWTVSDLMEWDEAAPLGAGQGGEGYNKGGEFDVPSRPEGVIEGGDGEHGTLTSNGAGGLFTDAVSASETVKGGGDGHVGGTVIYLTSNVYGSVSGTNIDIYNGTTGWMSGGAGGAGGGYNSHGGSGGLIGYPTPTYNDVGWGVYAFGSAGGSGGPPGRIFWDNSANLVTSNTKTNDSSNTMYGWDGSWA